MLRHDFYADRKCATTKTPKGAWTCLECGVVVDAQAMSAREELLALNRERSALEKEMLDLTEALQAGNMGGISTPLVDREGFPRADVDVFATRTMRHRLAVLNTDHKALMARIEQGLHALHAAPQATGSSPPSRSVHVAAPAPRPSQPPPQPPPPPPTAPGTAAATGTTPPALGTSTAPVPMEVVEAGDVQPFAEIDAVAEGGPAAAAGLAVGDRLLRFGGVNASNHDGLRALARLTQRSEGETITLLVQRGASKLALQLQPRRWAGNGLLGCHLMPL